MTDDSKRAAFGSPDPACSSQGFSAIGAVLRFAVFLGLWAVMNGSDPLGLFVGVVVSVAVTWLSLQILPQCPSQIRPGLFVMQVGQFFWNSVVAGVDVALRAFYPKVRVNPGYVICPCRIPEGTSRDVFLAISSLVPGSLPAGVEDGHVILHCLDIELPVAAQMAANEKDFMRVLGKDLING